MYIFNFPFKLILDILIIWMLFNFVKLSKMYDMRLKKIFAFQKLARNSQSNKIQNY